MLQHSSLFADHAAPKNTTDYAHATTADDVPTADTATVAERPTSSTEGRLSTDRQRCQLLPFFRISLLLIAMIDQCVLSFSSCYVVVLFVVYWTIHSIVRFAKWTIRHYSKRMFWFSIEIYSHFSHQRIHSSTSAEFCFATSMDKTMRREVVSMFSTQTVVLRSRKHGSEDFKRRTLRDNLFSSRKESSALWQKCYWFVLMMCFPFKDLHSYAFLPIKRK